MTSTADSEAPKPVLSTLIRLIPLLVVGLVLGGPTIARLGQQVWSQEFGAHGPIVLATGAWLLWRRIPAMTAEATPGNLVLTFAAIVVALPLYVVGRAYDLISLEAAGVYGFGLALLDRKSVV